jgi:hypothetical protein
MVIFYYQQESNYNKIVKINKRKDKKKKEKKITMN